MIAPSGIGRPGGRLPVLAHVGELVQPVVLVGEAGLVDDEAGVDLAVPHRGHDLVERHDHDLADPAGHRVRRPQPEQQVRGRALARHRDRPPASGPAPGSRVSTSGPQPRPERAAAGQQRVLVEHPRQHGVRHLQHVELAALGHAVGDVDVGEGDVERGRARDPAVGPGVEDEGVVRAGRVGDPQRLLGGVGRLCRSCRGSNSGPVTGTAELPEAPR